MRLLLFYLSLLYAASAAPLSVRGVVLDPSNAAISGAQVSAVNRLGVLSQTVTDISGAFSLKITEPADTRVVITAPGFETKTLPAPQSDESLTVHLGIAPQVDSVRVIGSAMDVPLSEQGSTVTVIPREEIAQRNEAMAVDLLRYLPGIAVGQNSGRGGAAGLFIRGGDYNFNLVQIDGVTVNSFGGAFDFAHFPTNELERIEVVQGPQSAVYGAYANSGVVNLVTRSAEESMHLDLLAEGGTYRDRRFAIGAAGMVGGFGVAAFASRLDNDGPVANSDYRNENVTLHIDRAFGRQNLAFSGYFDANAAGAPGPYGSDPAHDFTGLDLISRNTNDFSSYSAHHQIEISPRFRQDTFASFFLDNAGYSSPYGFSYNKDLRGQAETRSVVSVARWYTSAAGVSLAREEVKNTFLSDDNFNSFPLHRDDIGVYWENRFQVGRRLFLNAGLREELIRTPFIPENLGSGRPAFPADTISRLNPKVAATYTLRTDRASLFGSTRLHSSVGTGIRPPSGLELAFTNNPALKPERTKSLDAGVEQRLFRDMLSLDATYFYNRFYDLIVSLGGDLAKLSSYTSDNLSNTRAQGLELAARFRPARWMSLAGSYTHLDSEILSLDGSTGLAPLYFKVGQPLIRRPPHSGAVVSSFSYGRVSANVTGYFRGSDLDVEPTYGAYGGLFRAAGFANLGINLNVRLRSGVTAYGSLRNALNRSYEEVLGYPALKLNFVAGMKWVLPGVK
ncbi:MAG: TonB-dependent receptor [Bryobacteraceae bacterium]